MNTHVTPRGIISGAIVATLALLIGAALPKCEGRGSHPFTQSAAVTNVNPFPLRFGLELGTGEPGSPRQPKNVYDCRSYWYAPGRMPAVTCKLIIAPVSGSPVIRTMSFDQAAIPFINTNVDWSDTTAGFAYIGGGAEKPYIPGRGSIDFSEVNCRNLSGLNWCEVRDSNGDCMNVPGSGQWAGFVVASGCVRAYTPEEWLRFSTNGGWAEENHHFGTVQGAFSGPACNVNPPPSYCLDLAVETTGDVFNFPQS